MDENRKYRRWKPARERKATVRAGGFSEETGIIDISTGGMKFSFARPLDAGTSMYADLTILPGMGPFYIAGTVVRVERSGGRWNAAVRFDRVRTYDFIRELQVAGGALC